MKKALVSLFASIFLIFLVHHAVVYLHEWTHGFTAWITGYKASPFHIHYGSQWLTLWDIDEAVNYQQIYADGKAAVVAWIAIAPVLMQMILFPFSLRMLQAPSVQKNRWIYLSAFLTSCFLLMETYAYIPIRTFSQSEDIHNFLTSTGLSPWAVAIPGALFVMLGTAYIFWKILPQAFAILKITRPIFQLGVKLAILIFLLGYYGGGGFMKDDPQSQALSTISWMALEGWVLIQIFVLLYKRNKTKRAKKAS